MPTFREFLNKTSGCFIRRWKTLFITDLMFKLLALVLLGPAIGVAFRLLLALSGSPFLSDEDILRFILTPLGLPTALLIGALQFAVALLGFAALFVVFADRREKPISATLAIRRTLAFAPSILRLALQMIGRLTLLLAPFLIAIGAIYAGLLGEHDVNFYLQQRPPVFFVAVGLASIVLGILVKLLVRLLLNWVFALPILLFEKVNARTALQQSRQRAKGARIRMLNCLAVWFIPMAIISGGMTGLFVGAAELLVPE